MTPHEQAHAEHMERVRAVHRRSAFERAICKLAYFDNWERRAEAGDEPPMDERGRAQHQYVRELVQAIRAEMIEHGQIEPA